MKKILAFILVLCVPLSLFGCAGKNVKGEVNVYNWGEYIDESVLDDFFEATGIKVNYTNFASNETLYSVLKTTGGNYDVIIPSDYMISRLIEEDMLEKIDFSNIPNFDLIDEQYKNLEYDPAGEYSVPYMSGTVGIIYNTSMIEDEITSWSALFDEKYSGNILMFDNSRDAMGIALKYLGYDQNTTINTELEAAYNLLREQKPILQAYVMDQIFDKLESGEAAIGPYYAGDYITMSEENPDLAFVIPEEGSNWFVDAMCIPKGAANKENAELFINFMCSTDVCIANMDAIGYTSANLEAAQIYAEELDEETYKIMFPPADVLARCDIFTNLPQETLDLYDQYWIMLKT
jgi:spermidine/putrescine transport system substrate-binding protein